MIDALPVVWRCQVIAAAVVTCSRTRRAAHAFRRDLECTCLCCDLGVHIMCVRTDVDICCRYGCAHTSACACVERIFFRMSCADRDIISVRLMTVRQRACTRFRLRAWHCLLHIWHVENSFWSSYFGSVREGESTSACACVISEFLLLQLVHNLEVIAAQICVCWRTAACGLACRVLLMLVRVVCSVCDHLVHHSTARACGRAVRFTMRSCVGSRNLSVYAEQIRGVTACGRAVQCTLLG